MAEQHLRLLTDALAAVQEGTALERVCAASIPLLDVDGVAVGTMSAEDGDELLAIAGPRARVLYQLQFELGEGPARDAYAAGHDVLVDDLTGDGGGRWPAFTQEALATGARALFAFTAQLGGIRIGVLEADRARPGTLTNEQRSLARRLTELCSMLVIDARVNGSVTADEHLTTDWPDRAVIHQATGMVAAQIGSDLASALARLRGLSFSSGRTLHAVAVDVVERRVRLDP